MMRDIGLKIVLVVMVVSCFIFTGCAGQQKNAVNPPPSHSDKKTAKKVKKRDHLAFLNAYDPFEPVNRSIYRFNTIVDNKVLEPIVRVYDKVVPLFVRDRISNFFSNIGEIPTLTNCLLQGKGQKSGEVLGRFMVNSTVGVLGLWDPATGMGLIKYNEDFGQTLGVYGVKPGPYLILPILGPSSLRDTTGSVADAFTKMLAVGAMDINTATDLGLSVVDGLELRASLPFSYGDFDSPFEYDLVRTLYLDMRELLVNDGAYIEENRKVNKSKRVSEK